MRHGNTWVAISGALLVTCILSGCELPRGLSEMMGDERTVPEGANVSFNKPHRPILNPMTNYAAASDTPQNMAMGDAALEGQRTEQQQPYHTSSAAASAQGRRIPSENRAMLSGASADATMADAARPATAIAIAAPVTSGNAPAQASAAAAVPVDTALNEALARPSELDTRNSKTYNSEVRDSMAMNQPASAPVTSSPTPAPLPESHDAQTRVSANQSPLALTQPVSSPPPAQNVASTDKTDIKPTSPDWSAPQNDASTPAAPPAMDIENLKLAEPLANEPVAGEPIAGKPEASGITLTPPSAPKPDQISSATATTTTATPVMADNEQNMAAMAASAPAETPSTPAETAPAATSANGYPVLATVPDAPKHTPEKDIASDMRSLNADRTKNQAAGQALLSNADSTVMTSPKTGELVGTTAQALSSAAPAAGGDDLTIPPSADIRPNDTIGKALQAEEAKGNDTAMSAPPSIDSNLANTKPADTSALSPLALTAPAAPSAAPANAATDMPAANSPLTLTAPAAQMTPPASDAATPAPAKAEAASAAAEEKPAMVETATHVADSTSTDTASAPAQHATPSPLALTAEVAKPAKTSASAPAVMASTSAQTASAAAEPVHLHAPFSTPEASASAPANVPTPPATAAVADAPVVNPSVTNPSVVNPSKELSDVVTQNAEEPTPAAEARAPYLPDSRYAKRRLPPVNEAY